MPHKRCSDKEVLKFSCLLTAAEEEVSVCLPLLLPCLTPFLNTFVLLYRFTERQLAMTLEREKSVYWLCITENKKGSVPLLGVWQFMKWCFLRSVHWDCLPVRTKAVSVCKPGGCSSCLAMLKSQLSSKASASPMVLGPLTQWEGLDCSSENKWSGCRNSQSKAPIFSMCAAFFFPNRSSSWTLALATEHLLGSWQRVVERVDSVGYKPWIPSSPVLSVSL